MMPENLNIRLDQDLTNQMTVNKNLTQEIIVTNTDKITILLNDHHKIIRKRTEWINPFGIFITVLTTLLTAKFDETKFGVSPDLWKSIFIIVCLISFFYTAYSAIMALRYGKQGTISEFIKKLKNESAKQGLPQGAAVTQGIIILSATYLWSDGQIDVTDKIKELVSKGIHIIMVDPSTFGIIDPAHKKLKTLKIHCRINGMEREFTHTDGERFRLE